MAKGRMKSVATADTKQAQKAYEDLKNKMRGVSTEAHRGGQSMTAMSRIIQNESGKIEKSIGNIGKVIAGAFAFREAAGFLNKSIQIRGEMQKLEIAFNTMLKSEEKTNALMGQMVKTAATTPFELMDVASGAKSLLAYGVAAEEVNETIIRLGNIAAALNIPLGDMAYLFGTTMTQGKVLSKDMYQFMGRGIPIAEELAKQFGVAKDEILGMCSEGKVGFEDIKKALWSMTDEGGKFYNLMQEQSKTLAGQLSNLQDSFDMMLNDLGSRIEDTASKGIEAASWMLDHYEAIGKAIMGLIATYGAYKAAMLAVYAIEKMSKLKENIQLVMMYRKELGLMTAVQQAFGRTIAKTTAQQVALNTAMKANIFIAIASAVVGLVAALASFNKKQKEAIRTAGEAETQIEAEKNQLDELMKVAKDEKSSKEEKAKAIQTINARYGDYLDNMIAETASVKDLSSAYDSLTASIEAKYLAQLKEQMVGEKQTAYNNEEADLWGFFRTGILADSGLSQKQQGAFTSEMQRYMSKFAKFQNPQEIYNKFLETYKKYGGDSMSSRTQGKLYSHIWDFKEAQGDLQVAEKAFEDFASGYSGSMKKVSDAGKQAEEEQVTTLQEVTKQITEAKAAIKALESKAASSGLTDTEIKDLESKRKELDELEKKYKNLSGKEYGKTDKKDEKVKTANDKYLKWQQDFAREMSRLMEDTNAEISDSEIEAMDEGMEKSMAQIRANYEKRKQEIKRNYEDQKREIENQQREQYKATHNGSDEGFVFDEENNPQMILLNVATSGEYKAAQNERVKAEEELLSELLDKYRTYAQAKKQIDDELNAELALMKNSDGSFKGDFSQENVDLAIKKAEEAKDALAVQYMESDAEFQIFIGSLADKTVKQLEVMLAEAEAELQKLDLSGVESDELTRARAEVAKLKEQLKTLKVDNGVKESTVSWADLNGVLSESADKFSELGDIIPGMAGQMLSGIGSIATAAIGVANGITAIGKAASAAEKASAILAIVSAAIQVVQFFTSAIEENKAANEAAAQAAREYAFALEEINAQERRDSHSNIFDTDKWGEFQENVKLAEEQITSLKKEMEKGTGWDYKDQFDFTQQSSGWATFSKKYRDKVKELYNTGDMALVSDMRSGWQKFWGTGNDNLNIASLQDFMDEEGMLDTDKLEAWYQAYGEGLSDEQDNLVNNLLESWEAYYATLEEMQGYLEGMMGNSAELIADKWLESFDETGSAITDLSEISNDFAKSFAKDMLKNMLMTQVFNDEAQAQMFEYLKAGDVQGATAYYDQLVKQAEQLGDAANGVIQSLGVTATNIEEEEPDDDRRGATKSGITASQDSVDYQNARLTTMQGHTFEINEGVKSMKAQHMALISNTASILREVQGIHEDTTSIASETAAMRADLSAVKSELSSINKNGVTIKR